MLNIPFNPPDDTLEGNFAHNEKLPTVFPVVCDGVLGANQSFWKLNVSLIPSKENEEVEA